MLAVCPLCDPALAHSSNSLQRSCWAETWKILCQHLPVVDTISCLQKNARWERVLCSWYCSHHPHTGSCSNRRLAQLGALQRWATIIMSFCRWCSNFQVCLGGTPAASCFHAPSAESTLWHRSSFRWKAFQAIPTFWQLAPATRECFLLLIRSLLGNLWSYLRRVGLDAPREWPASGLRVF